MSVNDILQEPDEHIRFAAYLDELRRVSEADETGVVSRVLADPDQTMAQSAVLRHLDRRADDLRPRPCLRGVGTDDGTDRDPLTLPDPTPAGVVTLPRHHT